MSFRRILVPLDGSPLAERALYPATAFAEAMNARIFLLRVAVPLLLNLDPKFYQHTIKTRQDQAKQYLQRIQSRFEHSTIDIETRVLIGQAATSILKCAEEEDIDLLIISSRDRPGGRRLMHGSVATKMLSNPPCSLVIIHPQINIELFSVQRILLPLLESSLIEQTLIQALNLAESMSAELLILAASSSMQRLIKSLRDRHNLHAVTDSPKSQPFQESYQTFIKDKSVSVSIHTLDSLSAEDIFEFADRQQVDLIAVLSQRCFGIGQWIFRSTIEKVAHGAKYVTLIFQEKKALQ